MAFNITVSYRGKSHKVLVQHDDPTLGVVAQEIARLTGVSYPTIKLVSAKLKGGLLPAQHAQDTCSCRGLASGSKVMLVGSTEQEVASVMAQKEDSTVPGFQHELRRAALRRRGPSSLAPAAPPSAEFTFATYQTLDAPSLRPPPSDALKLLYRLASDPGILGVMAKHQWKVGLLSEMPPEGKVGVSAVCVLGYNVNKGQEISLRLRTDDLKGFRKYQRIRETLIHELAHMVHSEHDVSFKALNSQLLRECAEFDWTGAGGRWLLEGWDEDGEAGPSELDGWVDEADVMAASRALSGRTLRQLAGGEGPAGEHFGDARAAAAAAALSRLQAASTQQQLADLPPVANAVAPELQHEHLDPATDAAEAALRRLGSSTAQKDVAPVPPQGGCAVDGASTSAPAPAGACAAAAANAPGVAGCGEGATVAGNGKGMDGWALPSATPSADAAGRRQQHAEGCAQHWGGGSAESATSAARHGEAGRRSLPGAAGHQQVAPGASSDALAGHNVPMDIDFLPGNHQAEHTAGSGLETCGGQEMEFAGSSPSCQQGGSTGGAAAAEDRDLDPAVAAVPIGAHQPSEYPLAFLPQDDPAVLKYRQAEAALQLLATTSGREEQQVALETVQVMLRNILDRPGEDRLRRVRLHNAAVHRKVGRLEGAVKLLEAVGFVREASGGEEVLRLQRDDPGLLWLVLSAVHGALGSQRAECR